MRSKSNLNHDSWYDERNVSEQSEKIFVVPQASTANNYSYDFRKELSKKIWKSYERVFTDNKDVLIEVSKDD